MAKLSQEQIIQLLDLIKDNECLWMYTSENYKNKQARLAAYKLIMEKMNFVNIEEVKKKIKSVRDTYIHEKNKIKNSMKSGAGIEDKYTTRLVWYSIADSFWSFTQGRDSYNSIKETINIEKENSSSAANIQDLRVNDEGKRSLSNKENVTSKIPKKRMNHDKEVMPTYIQNALSKLESLKSSIQVQDEFYYFGQTVASHLRALPMTTAVKLQSEILNLLCNERQNYRNESCSSEQQSFDVNDIVFEDIPTTSSPKKSTDILSEAISASFDDSDLF